MTKEEYLKMYKEDKLAELCEQFEAKNFKLTEDIVELKHKCGELNIFGDTNQLFEKLKTLPAKDFIELYYMMDKIMKDQPVIRTVLNTTPPNISTMDWN